jgi:hypothetical protein
MIAPWFFSEDAMPKALQKLYQQIPITKYMGFPNVFIVSNMVGSSTIIYLFHFDRGSSGGARGARGGSAPSTNL